jgi:hypothetical protein
VIQYVYSRVSLWICVEESVTFQFGVLSRNFPGGTEEITKNLNIFDVLAEIRTRSPKNTRQNFISSANIPCQFNNRLKYGFMFQELY